MKETFYLLTTLSFLIYACGTESTEETASDKESKVIENKAEIDYAKFEEMAAEPCKLLTKDIITSQFDVTEDELEDESYVRKTDKISSYDICKYLWKKPNYKEIEKRNQEKMMEHMTKSMKTGNTSGSVDMAMSMEKPNFFVGVTNLDTYEDEEKAISRFDLLHKVPEKEDLEKLNEQIDKQDTLSNQGKDMGKDLAGGIVSNMKFEKVEGIGTAAYWDFMGNKLDILYGTVQIGIVVHISEDHEENVVAAKNIANEIMEQF